MSTTLEAESDVAAAEAQAAIAAENATAIEAHEKAELERRAEELEAAAASGKFEESAGLTAEAEAGAASGDEPMTQEQREAAAEHDGDAKPKRTRKRNTKTNEQGTLEGMWEKLIGGTPDAELKLALSKPAGVQLENVPETLLKGSVHRLVLTVKVTGFASDDTLDPETHDVASSSGKRKLRVTSGSFLEPEEYITSADAEDETDADADTADEPTE